MASYTYCRPPGWPCILRHRCLRLTILQIIVEWSWVAMSTFKSLAINPTIPSNIPEIRTIKLALAATTIDYMWISKRYSNWITLLRVTALVQRFIYNCRSRFSNTERQLRFISLEEMNQAKIFWAALSQAESFPNETSSLKAGRLVHRGSYIRVLNQFWMIKAWFVWVADWTTLKFHTTQGT